MSGEGCASILRGLVGFQKRMRQAEVFGDSCEHGTNCAEQLKSDLYICALEEAIRCVEIVYGLDSKESSS